MGPERKEAQHRAPRSAGSLLEEESRPLSLPPTHAGPRSLSPRLRDRERERKISKEKPCHLNCYKYNDTCHIGFVTIFLYLFNKIRLSDLLN